MCSAFLNIMELYIYENYKDMFPEAAGRQLTDILIKEALADCGIENCRIMRTDKGKPYVEQSDSAAPVYISVSHSGAYFVCLISDCPVGVDIQTERKVNAGRIGRRCFTCREQQLAERQGDDGFFSLWTRKEAYSKYTGLGMEEILKGTEVIGRDDVEFTDFQLEKGVYCSCCRMKEHRKGE